MSADKNKGRMVCGKLMLDPLDMFDVRPNIDLSVVDGGLPDLSVYPREGVVTKLVINVCPWPHVHDTDANNLAWLNNPYCESYSPPEAEHKDKSPSVGLAAVEHGTPLPDLSDRMSGFLPGYFFPLTFPRKPGIPEK